MRRNWCALGAGVCLVFLAGCDAAMKGAPKSSLDPDRDFAATIINSSLSEERLRRLAANPAASPIERNAVIEARMAEIDYLYYEFENNLSREIRQGNFMTSIASLLVGTAGSVASGGTSQDLSAVSAVITGSSAAYQKEILLDQTLQAIKSQMRANRSRIKADIISNLSKSTSEYSIQSAVSDLAEYEAAGTLNAAVAGITETARQEEKAAKSELQTAKIDRKPLAATVQVKDIAAFIARAPTSAERTRRNAKATECFENSNASDKPANFQTYLVNPSSYQQLGNDIAQCLGL